MPFATSSVHDFKCALADALMARAGLAGVQVLSAPEFQDIRNESIQLHDAAGDQEWYAIGRMSREESYAVDGMVWALRPGAGETINRAVRGRAFDLFAEVEACLWADPTMGGVDRVAEIGHLDVAEGANPNGRVCRIDFTVKVTKRMVKTP